MPKKELVQIVNQAISNKTGLHQMTNNVFDVNDVRSASFGNVSMSKSVTNFLGSSSGFKKAILSVDFQRYQVIVNSKSSKSKIIGSNKSHREKPISRKSNTRCMTELISAKTNALSRS